MEKGGKKQKLNGKGWEEREIEWKSQVGKGKELNGKGWEETGV